MQRDGRDELATVMDFPAVTFVKDYLLQLTLYRDFLDANNIKKLLAEQTV